MAGIDVDRQPDGQRTGEGVIHYPNGDKYEGNFVVGKRQGRGKYTFADSSVYEGVRVLCHISSAIAHIRSRLISKKASSHPLTFDLSLVGL